MYQTVGHTLIPLYADICPFPLYRQEICGTAINQTKEYYIPADTSRKEGTPDPAREDETESMIALLRRIKRDYPEANAVCSGAILSTYQRTRIENVALRMGLVPLAYLWQYPELPTPEPRKGGLLEDMAAVGFDARIIKVASGGLDDDLLWHNVCAESTRKRIARAMERFGGSVLGEGGEFETLVVEGPSPIFKGAVEVRANQKRLIQGGGGEAWMTFAGGSIRRKTGVYDEGSNWLESLRIPDLLDRQFTRLLGTLDHEHCHWQAAASTILVIPSSHTNQKGDDKCHISTGRWTGRITNISATDVGKDSGSQMERIGQMLISVLKRVVRRPIHDVVFATILLRSMDDFQVVNQRYAELFSARPNPPARVTIACGDSLPEGVNVAVSVVVSLHPDENRQCLHVKSRSYWAPANIGPYSQAISVPIQNNGAGAIVYIAGQIPLVPASMDIATRASLDKDDGPLQDLADFRLQSTLALQHLWRIGKVVKVGWWTGAIAFLVAGGNDIRTKARLSASAWKRIHIQNRIDSEDVLAASEDAEFDVWNQQQNKSRSLKTEKEDDVLPDFTMVSKINANGLEAEDAATMIPPFFAVEVAQLPRGSEIEWQALGVARAPVKVSRTASGFGDSVTACSLVSDEIHYGFIGIKNVNSVADFEIRVERALLELQKISQIPNAGDGQKTIYTSHRMDCSKFEGQVVPCRTVWNSNGEKIAAAILSHYEIGDVRESM
ncbi:MAG: hypothetical protein L6R39_000753 [Caloplaca ligustica]|nr:MAG: hypothetical protein L6R39_000753 [Caloplaca ligustica]